MLSVLKWAGKTGGKAVAVFAGSAREATIAVRHVKQGVVDLPIFLFCLEAPPAPVCEACAKVIANPSAVALFFRAQRELWRYWIALGVAPWTGKRGNWPLKLAPFFLPPFRVLVLNENDDFFPGKPGPVRTHVTKKTNDWLVQVRTRFVRRMSGLGHDQFQRIRQVVRGLLAYPFAFFAQQYSPLSRFVFQFMGGAETLTLSSGRTDDQSILVFEYHGREWRWRELEQFLGATESRWILFQQAGTEASVDDMLPLFSHNRTFAVSRQNAFRGWQKLLFPTAPFQTLQPDEASRVFAPFSTQILVERDKLRSLGIPKLSECGSNWYLLFWKAAAAGWRSYSVGGAAKVNELPGRPYYDAQFVHALLVEPSLARLKPRNPSLARGNISIAKAGGRGFRGLPRVLVVSPYLPYPLSHGGAVRIFSLCQALADRIDFVLACFREKNDFVHYDELHKVFREVYAVAVDEKHSNPHLPIQVSGYESSSMRALIRDLYFRLRIEVLQIEYTQLAAYRETVPDLPAILVEHDITFTLYRQLADRAGSPQAEREYWSWLKFETARFNAFEQVWTMSDHDRNQAIEAGSAPSRTLTVPNGVDLERFSGSASYKDTIEEILYVGSFRHRPNYLGFEELRDNVMPWVWTDFPGIRLRVMAGPEHEKYWTGSRELDPRIIVHGFVEDIAPLYRDCQLVVVPLPVSAGTNVKVMEALASERAVVSTPVGCVGLGLEDGKDVLVRDLGPEFAAAILELAADAGKRRTIAKHGRETVEARFGWDSIADSALDAYRKLLGAATGADVPVRDRRESFGPPERRRQHTLQ